NPAKPEFTYRWSKMILPPMSGHVRKYAQEKMDKINSNTDLHTKWLARTIYKFLLIFTHGLSMESHLPWVYLIIEIVGVVQRTSAEKSSEKI
ncbi:MAG: hypothetical protein AAFQ29_10745, partial [Pseudomonadota bacterium]